MVLQPSWVQLLGGLVLFLAVGCSQSSPPGESGANDSAPAASATASLSRGEILRYAPTPALNSAFEYFLVAGSREDANFAQEVIEQRNYLIERGVAVEKIACFYSIPAEREFLADELHYRALAGELASCFPASPHLVYELIQSAPKDRPTYLYVTSHGSPPLRQALDWDLLPSASRNKALQLVEHFPEVDQYELELSGSETDLDGTAPIGAQAVVQGIPAREALFSPRYLREAMVNLGTGAHRYVVLQGCYSGGFLRAPTERLQRDTLADLENITVMTASREDRSSFGCSPGRERTFYGGAYNDYLKRSQFLPEQIDWQDAFKKVALVVRRMETEFFRANPKEKVEPSFPQFLHR